ncbi:ABC transporter ATP-binding protein [Gluconobacter sphaericus]|uniref:ABC transporter ATP-binding protein n=1 Tax=Gluconobacter sphaericus NBRC 12467 TaxID=1307951 RepID=A0AA37SIM3_9PROT|nr:ABC transporter ATP-binding protein [Gluconobacter sphaericus]MBF0886057.1 ABC transporter ATP-binding protein [Gluconobacter sphaericus]MBS1086195.1 ABC transporter ATP-binding protein [Gluconobacter sphaericus]MBS1100148.1 ABC transporter ATP-binding protein [Gluconobacter sphaericus]QQX90101.1 ABC transporter ATP-binding protein [Gluconobacter sphaericus]GEB42808.1 ABC transporter ATP-binding protein [Gluconobacter sphaericus NBRC 12467]
MTDRNAAPLLSVRNLTVNFGGPDIVDDLSFDIGQGEIVALVGESGSGKSVGSLAIMGLLENATIQGSASLSGGASSGGQEAPTELVGLPARRLRALRGRRISMIFQDPLSSLDPLQTIGGQIREVLKAHTRLTGAALHSRAIALLEQVGIVDPEGCLALLPQRLSGGMRQRVMIALAIAAEPDLLFADEPTTALDVTVQAQVLRLLKGLRDQTGMAMVFITHNLAVASAIADRVIVLYAGQVVEDAPADVFFRRPAMPYSRALLSAAPRLEAVLAGYGHLEAPRGQVPSPGQRGTACRFAARCDDVRETPCLASMPSLVSIAANGEAHHTVRCARWEELAP